MVPNAGLLPAAVLAQRIDLAGLVDDRLRPDKALLRRHVTATLSNGHVPLLIHLVRFADLRFDAVLSAQLAGRPWRRRPCAVHERSAWPWSGAAYGFAHSWTPRVSAPSTTRLVPVVKLEVGLARNTTARAISCGVPIRPVGLSARAVAYSSGFPS